MKLIRCLRSTGFQIKRTDTHYTSISWTNIKYFLTVTQNVRVDTLHFICTSTSLLCNHESRLNYLKIKSFYKFTLEAFRAVLPLKYVNCSPFCVRPCSLWRFRIDTENVTSEVVVFLFIQFICIISVLLQFYSSVGTEIHVIEECWWGQIFGAVFNVLSRNS